MVIGLNHRTAPLAMRERFWIGENRRYEVLRQLRRAEGIEEVVVLSTCCRTEFLVWADEPTAAANSLLQFLGSEYGLKLSEWEHFYRLLDDAALTHVFSVTAGVDSMFLAEAEIAVQVRTAWEQAQTVGATGSFLNATLEKALSVSERVHKETSLRKLTNSIPGAALEVAEEIFGSLQGRKLLLLGSGKMSEFAARQMIENGAGPITVIDPSLARAQELAESLGGTAAALADRWKAVLRADIVISATGCPHVVLTREEAERIAIERNRVALLILDIGMPRDVDPEVRRVDGILLFDLEGLERAVRHSSAERSTAAAAAEAIVRAEAQSFRSQLPVQGTAPTLLALRHRLDEICRQELESFLEERGPFTREQDQSLHAVTNQVIQKIASFLARELKELPEKDDQEKMTAAVTRLFHLESPPAALAGTRLGREENERKAQQVAINY